jgi:hypothetical protein
MLQIINGNALKFSLEKKRLGRDDRFNKIYAYQAFFAGVEEISTILCKLL